jgi:hypothetical protein
VFESDDHSPAAFELMAQAILAAER